MGMPWWGWLLLTVFVFLPIVFTIIGLILAATVAKDVGHGYCCKTGADGSCVCVVRGKNQNCSTKGAGWAYSPVDQCSLQFADSVVADVSRDASSHCGHDCKHADDCKGKCNNCKKFCRLYMGAKVCWHTCQE